MVNPVRARWNIWFSSHILVHRAVVVALFLATDRLVDCRKGNPKKFEPFGDLICYCRRWEARPLIMC